MEVELFNDIGIVQRRTLDHCTRQLYGVEVGYGCDYAGAAHLISNLVQACNGTLGLELICYCPTRRLGRVAKILLLAQRVHLQYNAVGSKRQVLTLAIHSVNESEHLVYGAALTGGIRNLETPLLGSLKILIMPLGRQLLAKHKI